MLFLSIMKEIEYIEKVLSNNYGKEPIIRSNTWLNRYLENYREGRNIIFSALFGPLTAFINKNHSGYYNFKTHSLWIPTKNIEDNFIQFATYHELGHGYVYQRNSKFGELDSQMSKTLAMAGFKQAILSDQNLIPFIISRSINEGIADYLAIEAQKLESADSTDSKPYCFTREWQLANYQNPDSIIQESTPLSRDTAKNIASEGQTIVHELKKVNDIENIIERNKQLFSLMGYLRSNFVYFAGHYLVRSECEKDNKPVFSSIDKLIENHPYSLEELQNRVLENLD
jgi:hypothetical protein